MALQFYYEKISLKLKERVIININSSVYLSDIESERHKTLILINVLVPGTNDENLVEENRA